MLSRVADSLYWMSRYIERAEHITRLLDVNLNLMLDESSHSADHRWQRMLRALGSPREMPWTGDPYALTQALYLDAEYKGSILSCVTSARENARHVREQISTEQWQRLNSLYLRLTRPEMAGEMNYEQPQDALQQVMTAVHQFQGVSDSTMSHGEGWQFIQVGRYIERASATALLLEAYHEDLWSHPERIPEGNEYLEWMGLLRSATAFEAYCKVYTADVTPDRVLEFLLLDEEFPHSVRFSIDTLQNALAAIHGGAADTSKNRAEPLRRLIGRLQSSLNYSSVEEILSGDIVAYLRGIQYQCGNIHDMIYQLYIDYSIQVALAG
ncbi:MAG TPA: alpha-E domain-containing protein [Acidobacteriaceae bacterium]|nr:alpha-E domain-containing protein [Acidobacteriaceae bacterium]